MQCASLIRKEPSRSKRKGYKITKNKKLISTFDSFLFFQNKPQHRQRNHAPSICFSVLFSIICPLSYLSSDCKNPHHELKKTALDLGSPPLCPPIIAGTIL